MIRCRHAGVLLAAIFIMAACGAKEPQYSGTVQTESVAVGSQIGGRVIEIDAAVGTRVRHGSALLRLDPSLLQAPYDEALAQLAQAREHLDELRNGNLPTDVARAREQSAQAAAQYQQALAQMQPEASAQAAEIRDAQAALRLATVTLVRARNLAATGDTSRQALDQARAAYVQARARLAQARSNYAALIDATLPGDVASARAAARAQAENYQTVRNGPRSEDIAQASAQLDAAQAAAQYARARLDEATVFAPADGVVESFNLHPGDLLGANQQAAVIDTFADPYTYIYASQSDLGALTSKTHVRVVSDADGRSHDGTIEAYDRTAQFTPQNVETADQRAELVYGVKIRIHDPRHQLLDGTTVTVYPH